MTNGNKVKKIDWNKVGYGAKVGIEKTGQGIKYVGGVGKEAIIRTGDLGKEGIYRTKEASYKAKELGGAAIRVPGEIGPGVWRGTGRGLKWIGSVAGSLILLLVFLAVIILGMIAGINYAKAGKIEQFTENFRTSFTNLPVVKYFSDALVLISQPSFAGDVWTAEVDQNVDTKLGLFIEEFKPYQTDYYSQEPVVLSASIVVESLPEGLKLDRGSTNKTFSVQCMERDTKSSANVFPKGISNVETKGVYPLTQYNEYGIECRWDNYGAMGAPGTSAIVDLLVDYDFNTKGYLDVWLIDDNERASLRSKGIKDVFKYLGINEPGEIKSIYTAGPVEVALGVGKGDYVQPVGISKNEENIRILGITIRNKEDGEIRFIKGMTLQFPKGIKLDTIRGVCPFKEQSLGEQFNTYVWDKTKLSNYGWNIAESVEDVLVGLGEFVGLKPEVKREFYPIKTFRNFNCYTTIEGNEFLKQDTGFITKIDYRFETDYVYSAIRSTNLRFKDVEEGEFADVGGACDASGDLKDIKTSSIRCTGKTTTCQLRESAFNALLNAQQEAQKEGKSIVVSNAHRKEEHQKTLYERYLSGNGALACGPRDGSYAHCPHVRGCAADITNHRDVNKYMTQAGWTRPVKGEPWHYEYGR